MRGQRFAELASSIDLGQYFDRNIVVARPTKGTTMTRVFWAAAAIVIAVVFGHWPAQAYEAPWCVIRSEGYWDCQYGSVEECVRHGGARFLQSESALPRHRTAAANASAFSPQELQVAASVGLPQQGLGRSD